MIDDTAGYYQRHTSWRWSAGVATAADGRALAWNLVDGVNDPPQGSERTLWVDGEPAELEPVVFDAALSRVGGLRFTAEATREQDQNLLARPQTAPGQNAVLRLGYYQGGVDLDQANGRATVAEQNDMLSSTTPTSYDFPVNRPKPHKLSCEFTQ